MAGHSDGAGAQGLGPRFGVSRQKGNTHPSHLTPHTPGVVDPYDPFKRAAVAGCPLQQQLGESGP